MKPVISCTRLSRGKTALNTGLLVFALLLIGTQGLSQSVRIDSFGKSKPITNRDVLEMLNAGLGNRVVAAKISSSACKFTTSSEALVKLKGAGADDEVLLTILQKETEQGLVTQAGPGAVELAPFGGPPPLTNKDVIKMIQGGITTKVVVAKVTASTCNFDTSPKALAELKGAGADDNLIMTVLKREHPGL